MNICDEATEFWNLLTKKEQRRYKTPAAFIGYFIDRRHRGWVFRKVSAEAHLQSVANDLKALKDWTFPHL